MLYPGCTCCIQDLQDTLDWVGRDGTCCILHTRWAGWVGRSGVPIRAAALQDALDRVGWAGTCFATGGAPARSLSGVWVCRCSNAAAGGRAVL